MANRTEQRLARQLAERDHISYTAALRKVREDFRRQQTERESDNGDGSSIPSSD